MIFILCLKKTRLQTPHNFYSVLTKSLSAIPLVQTTTQSPHTHRSHEWVISEEALLDFVKFIRR